MNWNLIGMLAKEFGWTVLLFALMLLLTAAIASLIPIDLGGYSFLNGSPLGSLVQASIVGILAFGLFSTLRIHGEGEKILESYQTMAMRSPIGLLFWAAAGAVAIVAVLKIQGSLALRFTEVEPIHGWSGFAAFPPGVQIATLILEFTILALLEIYFRESVLGSFARNDLCKTGLAVSSLVYAFVISDPDHFWFSMCVGMINGMILGAVYLKTRQILASILASIAGFGIEVFVWL